MLKNFIRQRVFALSRHLPRHLVDRSPLPDATTAGVTPIPASLSAHCLRVAVMDETQLWHSFGSHPEGLNPQEVSAIREKHGDFLRV